MTCFGRLAVYLFYPLIRSIEILPCDKLSRDMNVVTNMGKCHFWLDQVIFHLFQTVMQLSEIFCFDQNNNTQKEEGEKETLSQILIGVH